MLNNKEDYFNQSRELSLPSRCPIIEHCKRRADTQALFNNVDFEKACQFAGIKEPFVDNVGQRATLIGGGDNFIVSHLCPEVSLFECELSFYSKIPVTKAQYDKYMSPRDKILDTGHYSECAEYCVYSEQHKRNNKNEESETLSTYFKKNHQWIIGTLIALVGILVSLLP
ncbi:hypothetical protein JD508_00200 [Aeromonas jandaei]|uniref:hypothetical protein n=1 Tax=Aeromonas jandaei TaxID=650 RepID=UPI00191CD7F6|nr:hypothetical protein [Aeromonas jandaei]MBL0608703.1 hypothetical protein [Aeromonas jandaei]